MNFINEETNKCTFQKKSKLNLIMAELYVFLEMLRTDATNFLTNAIVNASRWNCISKSKKDVRQSKIGGVDKFDELVAIYRTRIR